MLNGSLVCKNLNENILIEIGTDENLGDIFALNSLDDIENEIDYFSTFSKPYKSNNDV